MTPRRSRDEYVGPEEVAKMLAAAGHPITPRRSHYLYSQILRALFDHYTRLETDAWAWPASRRKAARGE